MAQASAVSAQSAQLQRLINSLDGGATPAPIGNVLSDLDAINNKLV
jgi:hypothetical protein